jgi:simple sugar transport system permease protein
LTNPILTRIAHVAAGLACGVAVMVVALWLAGANPGAVLSSIFRSAITSRALQTDAVLNAIPVLLIALGSAACFRARFWNIGGEAYFYTGALVATAVGLKLSAIPAPLLVALMAIAAAAAGALLSGIVGILHVRRKVNEVVVTLMANLVLLQVVGYAIRGPLADPASRLGYSAMLPQQARLPAAGIGLPRVHAGLYVAIVAIAVMYYIVMRSTLGHRLRVIGENEEAAVASGIDASRAILFASVTIGLLGGLAGMLQVSGVTNRLYVGLSPAPGFGYIAIMTALLGGMHPFGVALATGFYSILSGASDGLQVEFGLQRGFVAAFFVVILLFVLASETLFARRARVRR